MTNKHMKMELIRMLGMCCRTHHSDKQHKRRRPGSSIPCSPRSAAPTLTIDVVIVMQQQESLMIMWHTENLAAACQPHCLATELKLLAFRQKVAS